MSNQELIQTGRRQMDETDQTIERSKKVAKSIPQDFEDSLNTLNTLRLLLGQCISIGHVLHIL